MRDHPIVRLGARIARHDPLYALASVLLLALGIGAVGAMLALYRGTLAQPPPLANWERLVVLRGSTAQATRQPLSFPDFEDLLRDVPALADLALTRAATVTLESGDDAPQRIAGARVTPNLTAVLGVRLIQGTGFDVAIGQPADQIVISERLWRGALGAQPLDHIQVRIGGRAVAVVGVLPVGLRFPTPDVDLWMPLAPVGNEARRDYAFTTPWGVLQPGRTLDEAREQIATRVAALAAEFPQSHSGLRIEPVDVDDDLFALHRPLIALFTLVGLLVFIAVAGNLMALSAARALARRGETMTRVALGATQCRLLGDTLSAMSALAAVAVAIGGLLAWGIVRTAEAADTEVFTALRATVDAGVIVGSIAGALLLIAASLAPTWWLQRRIAHAAPAVGSTRASTADRTTVRAAGLIIAVQMAMCFATVGTLLLAQAALAALERSELGFQTDDRFSVALGVPELEHAATITGFEAAIGEVSRMPGVEQVAAISRLPLLRGASSVGVVPASVGLPGEAAIPVDTRLIIGPVDAVLGLTQVQGRFFNDNDRRDAPPTVVIDRRFAEQFFAGRDPLGARVRLQIDPTIEWTIVGVIEPVRWRTFEDGDAPAVLIAAAQFANIAPMRNAQLIWRGHYDPATGIETLRAALRRGMPLLSADTPRALAAVVADASGQARMATRLLRLLTAIAMLLAVLGVGSLLLYRYERQRRAVGVRLCLGASRSRVIASALAESLILATVGGLIGAALVVAGLKLPAAARILPGDGLSTAMLAAGAVVMLLAVVGAIGPVWRIARLEPRAALQ